MRTVSAARTIVRTTIVVLLTAAVVSGIAREFARSRARDRELLELFVVAEAQSPTPINSVAVDLKGRYDKASYYELDNLAFEQALRKTFQVPCSAPSKYQWGPPLAGPTAPSPVLVVYREVLEFLRAKIARSTLFALEGDTATFDAKAAPRLPPPLTLVQHRLIEYRYEANHPESSSRLLLHIEMALHREAKFNGKHIEMWVIYDGTPQVVVANVLGVVFEDRVMNMDFQITDATPIEAAPSVIIDTSDKKETNAKIAAPSPSMASSSLVV